MEPHTSQSVFQQVNWNFCFFDYRNENEEAPLPETQHTWKNIEILEVGLQAFSPLKNQLLFFLINKLINSANA